MEKRIIKIQAYFLKDQIIWMIKTVSIIIISVTILGVVFFILVRNALRKKLDILLEEEEKRKNKED